MRGLKYAATANPLQKLNIWKTGKKKLFKKHPILGKIKIKCDLCKPITEDDWPGDIK